MRSMRRRRVRRGSLLIETAIAALMLSLAMGLVTKVLAAVATERRAWDRRQVALSEVAGVMERLCARPYEALVAGQVSGVSPSKVAAKLLPRAQLRGEVVEDPAGGMGSKRLVVEMRWRNRAGDWDAPVRMTTWLHRRKGGA